MKALIVSLTLAGGLALAVAVPIAHGGVAPPGTVPVSTIAPLAAGHTYGAAIELGFTITRLTIEAVLDLQDAWNCYVEGFRKRHPTPRPRLPGPDAVPAPATPLLPHAIPGASTTAPRTTAPLTTAPLEP